MHKHEDCDHNDNKHSHKHPRKEYARAFVIPQVYENLFSVDEALKRGTIFKDLYQPFHSHKRIN